MTDHAIRASVDMRAVARVASRVELTEIRLVEASASRTDKTLGGMLEPIIQHGHSAVKAEGKSIRIESRYELTVESGAESIVSVRAVYHLFYALSDDEPVADEDLQQFAAANGAYHSWPFVRQLLFDLTARMGLPPFTLPVLLFIPPRPPKPKQPPLVGKGEEGAKV